MNITFLRGPTVPLKKMLLLMKYQHVADVAVEIHSCAKCVKGGLGGVDRHYYPSVFKMCLQKDRSPEKFQFCNF